MERIPNAYGYMLFRQKNDRLTEDLFSFSEYKITIANFA